MLQLGRPAELYDRPVTLLAAASVAPIGLVPARVTDAGGLAGYAVGPRTLPLWGPAPPGLAGRELVLGFRPEDVLPAGTPADGEAVVLDAVVTGVEYTGRHQAVDARRRRRPGDRARGRAGRARRRDAAARSTRRAIRSGPGTRSGSRWTPAARTSSTPAPARALHHP